MRLTFAIDEKLKLTDTIEVYALFALNQAQLAMGNRKVEIPPFAYLYLKVVRANKNYYLYRIPPGSLRPGAIY